MPNLAHFAGEGVFLDRHYSVFPTVARINAATIVMGRTPGAHGLAGNTLVSRDFDPSRVIQAMQPQFDEMARIDWHSG